VENDEKLKKPKNVDELSTEELEDVVGGLQADSLDRSNGESSKLGYYLAELKAILGYPTNLSPQVMEGAIEKPTFKD